MKIIHFLLGLIGRKNKKCCYNCRLRQREVQPKRRLICSATANEVNKNGYCKYWVARYKEE